MNDRDEISRLKDELYETRSALVRVAPDQFQDQLDAIHCPMETWSDLSAWEHDTTRKVVNSVEPDRNSRAPCPLCRSGVNGPYGWHGWAVPNGLTKHLDSLQCPVMRAAHRLLRDRHKEQFEAAEQRERQALAERKRTEPTILVDPQREPELWTRNWWQELDIDQRRSPEQLATTEQLLQQAGFQIEKTGNVTAYRLMHQDRWMVLADPRRAASIGCVLFKRIGKHRWKQATSRNLYLQGTTGKKWPAQIQSWLAENTGGGK